MDWKGWKSMAPELVVALDVPALEEARRLVALLRPAVRWFKVGMELFTAAGPAAVEAVRAEGGAVLLDLKLHDIPHTVAGAVRSAARLEAEMLTLHLAGGGDGRRRRGSRSGRRRCIGARGRRGARRLPARIPDRGPGDSPGRRRRRRPGAGGHARRGRARRV